MYYLQILVALPRIAGGGGAHSTHGAEGFRHTSVLLYQGNIGRPCGASGGDATVWFSSGLFRAGLGWVSGGSRVGLGCV